MSFDPVKDLRLPLRDIQRTKKNDPEAAYAKAKAVLGELLKRKLTDENLQLVYGELASVHYFFGHTSEAEPVVLAGTRRFPHSPLSWIRASEHYSFWCNPPCNLDQAKDFARQAVEVALASGNFIIHSLNELCRVARTAKDYPMMERAIKSLLDHAHVPGTMDSAYECDFLVNLPQGAVDDDLVRRLRDRCPARAS